MSHSVPPTVGPCQPSLAVSLIPGDITVSKLTAKEHALEVWTVYFDALKAGRATARLASPGSTDGLSSPWEEVPSLDSLRKASDTFWTPKRLKLGNMLSPENVPVLSNARGSLLTNVFPLSVDEDEEGQSQKVELALQKIFADWNYIEAKFQLVHLEFDTTACSKMKYQHTGNDVIQEIQDAPQENPPSDTKRLIYCNG
jgi:hypothetical protein